MHVLVRVRSRLPTKKPNLLVHTRRPYRFKKWDGQNMVFMNGESSIVIRTKRKSDIRFVAAIVLDENTRLGYVDAYRERRARVQSSTQIAPALAVSKVTDV